MNTAGVIAAAREGRMLRLVDATPKTAAAKAYRAIIIKTAGGMKLRGLGKVDGNKVVEVDGEKVRDNVETDFAGGSHHAVTPKIPKDEIWVENLPSARDKKHIAVHEAVEKKLMDGKGEGYEKAHAKANRVEAKTRKQAADDGTNWWGVLGGAELAGLGGAGVDVWRRGRAHRDILKGGLDDATAVEKYLTSGHGLVNKNPIGNLYSWYKRISPDSSLVQQRHFDAFAGGHGAAARQLLREAAPAVRKNWRSHADTVAKTLGRPADDNMLQWALGQYGDQAHLFNHPQLQSAIKSMSGVDDKANITDVMAGLKKYPDVIKQLRHVVNSGAASHWARHFRPAGAIGAGLMGLGGLLAYKSAADRSWVKRGRRLHKVFNVGNSDAFIKKIADIDAKTSLWDVRKFGPKTVLVILNSDAAFKAMQAAAEVESHVKTAAIPGMQGLSKAFGAVRRAGRDFVRPFVSHEFSDMPSLAERAGEGTRKAFEAMNPRRFTQGMHHTLYDTPNIVGKTYAKADDALQQAKAWAQRDLPKAAKRTFWHRPSSAYHGAKDWIQQRLGKKPIGPRDVWPNSDLDAYERFPGKYSPEQIQRMRAQDAADLAEFDRYLASPEMQTTPASAAAYKANVAKRLAALERDAMAQEEARRHAITGRVVPNWVTKRTTTLNDVGVKAPPPANLSEREQVLRDLPKLRF